MNNENNDNNNNDVVVEALSKAKWNETVEVSINNNDDGDGDGDDGAGRNDRSVVLLAASLDATNGGVQWNDVSSSGGGGGGQGGSNGENEAASDETATSSSIIIRRHLQTKKWIFPMLNDHVRNQMYQKAIKQASEDVIRRFIVVDNDDNDHAKTKIETTTNNELRCLDIGSGTGLLAMLSARSLQTCWQHQQQHQQQEQRQDNPNYKNKNTTTEGVVQVTSFEMSRPMAKLAQKIVQRNGFRRRKGKDRCSDDEDDSDIYRIPSSSSSSHNKIETFVDVIEGHSCEIDNKEPISAPETTATDPSPTMATITTSTCNNSHGGEDYTKTKHYHLCTSELLESGLLGEGWLPAMRDAWERHLHPDAIVVPQRASVYAQVITEDSGDMKNGNDSNANNDSDVRVLLEDFTGPYKVLGGFPNDTSMRLFTNSPGNDYPETLDGMTSGTGRQLCFGVDLPFFQQKVKTDGTQQHQQQFKNLSNPVKVLDIDVTSRETIPSPTGIHSSTNNFICKESGKAKGVLFWWELNLYNDITYSTRPGELPFQDHWHACLFLFPPTDSVVSLEKGQSACITTNHDDTSISFAVSPQNTCHHDAEGRTDSKRQRLSSELQTNKMISSSLVSPQRCLQLNCIDRSTLLKNSIDAALNTIGKDNACVLDVSDFSLCGVMAALLGAGKVTSLESSTGPYALATASACVAQLGNNLLPSSSDEKLRLIQCHNEQVTSEVLVGERPANIVVAEPFYTLLEGWTKQEALNLFYTLRGLKERKAVDEDAICVPNCAKVMAQAFEIFNLGYAYKPCQSDLCGFDHEILNEYWSLDQNCISHSIWNISSFSTRKPLTDAVVIATLDYQNNEIRRRELSTSIKYKNVGTCHVIVSWVDYELPNFQRGVTDSSNKDDHKKRMATTTLSTNTRLYNQSVFVLPKPAVVTAADIKNGLSIEMGHVFSDHE